MLEQAWERWRSAQGLAAKPLPPVSSYVGYSIEEPWGSPRVVFGVAAEDAERLAEFLRDSLDRGEEALRARDSGQWPAARGGRAPDGPAGPERGSLLDDVRGRIPVQGWPEFSESREQLNSPGPTGPATAHHGPGGWPGAQPGQAGLPNPVPGQASPAAAGPDQAGAAGAAGQGTAAAGQDEAVDRGQGVAGRPATAGGGNRAEADGGPQDGQFADDLLCDDEVEHAAWLSGIRDTGDTDDDEYCNTADDIPAAPAGQRDDPARPAEPAEPPGSPDPADSGVPGWPSATGLSHEPSRPASSPGGAEPPAGGPAEGPASQGPVQGRADRAHPGGPGDGAPGGTGRTAGDVASRPQDGPKAAAGPMAGSPGRGAALADTMAAELAGWAAGELPGQASARLAAWASVGGAVARGRAQARPGGGTATERVS